MPTTFRTSAAGGSTSGTGNRTATITPITGDLFVVFVIVEANTNAAPTMTDNNGGTYTLVTSGVKNLSGDTFSVFVRNQPLPSAAVTTVTANTGNNSAGELVILAYSGSERFGAAAIRQSARQQNQLVLTTPAPAFAVAALTTNPTAGGVMNGTNPATLTPPTGWTERQDVGQNTAATGLEVATRDSGFAGTTITWGSTSPSLYGDAIIEIDGLTLFPSWYPKYTPRPPRRLIVTALAASFFAPVQPPFVPPMTEVRAEYVTPARRRLQAAAQLAYVAPITEAIAPPVPQISPALYPDRISRRPHPFAAEQQAYTAPVTPPFVPPSSGWLPSYPDAISWTRRLPTGEQQAETGPIVPPDVFVAWAPTFPDRLVAQRPPQQSAYTAPVDRPLPQIFLVYPDQIAAQRAISVANQMAYAGPLFAIPYPSSWLPTWPVRIEWRRPKIAESVFITPILPPVPHLAEATYPDFARDQRMRAALHPAWTSNASILAPIINADSPLLAWSPHYPDRYRVHVRMLTAHHEAYVRPLVVPETWFPCKPDVGQDWDECPTDAVQSWTPEAIDLAQSWQDCPMPTDPGWTPLPVDAAQAWNEESGVNPTWNDGAVDAGQTWTSAAEDAAQTYADEAPDSGQTWTPTGEDDSQDWTPED